MTTLTIVTQPPYRPRQDVTVEIGTVARRVYGLCTILRASANEVLVQVGDKVLPFQQFDGTGNGWKWVGE